jgi:sec-independent protein translocase protein TatA
MIGTAEIIVIAAVVLVLFGAGAIPKFARSLGRAKREFEKGLREGAEEADAGDEGKKE